MRIAKTALLAIIFAFGSSNAEANRSINYSSIPCKMLGLGKVVASSKDSISRQCTLENYNNNSSVIFNWIYLDKFPAGPNNPLLTKSVVIYLCEISQVQVRTFLKAQTDTSFIWAAMIDTLPEDNLYKSLLKTHCDK